MQALVWALGSTIMLMLIYLFLPLGLSIKGRLLIVLIGLVLAMGGLAALTTFLLWQTVLLLVVTVFFIAYIMEGRMGASLFIEKVSGLTEESKEKEILPFDFEIRHETKDNFMNFSDVTPTVIPSVDFEDEFWGDSKLFSEQTLFNLEKTEMPLFDDEDLSFLLEPKNDIQLKEQKLEDEVSYLSDIESMLNVGSTDLDEILQHSWLEELELSSDNLTKSNHISSAAKEVLTAVKEAAFSKEGDEKRLT